MNVVYRLFICIFCINFTIAVISQCLQLSQMRNWCHFHLTVSCVDTFQDVCGLSSNKAILFHLAQHLYLVFKCLRSKFKSLWSFLVFKNISVRFTPSYSTKSPYSSRRSSNRSLIYSPSFSEAVIVTVYNHFPFYLLYFLMF